MATAISPARAALEQATAGAALPFDYAFRFTLRGERGATQRRQVEISVDGAFVAVSIGYGFIPAIAEKRIPLVGGAPSLAAVGGGATVSSIGAITLGQLLQSVVAAVGGARSEESRQRLLAALRQGIRINPRIAEQALLTPSARLDPVALRDLFELAGTAGDVQFLYALSDPGTGRDFQSEPILSTAGLGSADGERPFRAFPMPIRFEARSTVQMEITEVDRQPGELHVVLHGYRVLAAATASAGPTAAVALRRRRR